MSNKKRFAYVAATAYALITGFSFLFVKIALRYSDPMGLLAYLLLASFIAIVILMLSKVVKIKFSKEKIIKILPLSILYPLLFFSFQAFGLKYASSLEAGILNAAIPVVTAILAALFIKEKTTIFQKISVVMSVAGVIYITVNKGSGSGIGSILGVILISLSCIAISSYTVFAKKLSKDITSIELSFYMNIISFICFNLLSIGKHVTNDTIADFFKPLTSMSFVLSVLYLGVLSSLCTALLMNYALSKIDASKMSVFANLATVISIIAGAVILHEKLLYYHYIGSIFIVFGVLGTNFLDKKD